VQNNIIGLDPSGTQRRGNESMGVDHDWGVTGTMVGGTGYQQRNVISGNVLDAVQISHGVGQIYNSVVGNYIGTDPTGSLATSATANGHIGVYLEGKPTCRKACPPDEGHETVTDNVIVNSGYGGVMANKGTHDSLIARNRIGVTLNGTLVGNTQFGVMIATGATHITLGPGNEIAGSQRGIMGTPFGVLPVSSFSSPTEYNTITQNSIHDNVSALGIDWLPYDQVNKNGNGDPNFNQGVDVPVLTVGGGQVAVQTCASCTVELFGSNQPVRTFGSGTTYLMTGVAGASGSASFATPSGGWPAVITATTTTPLGSTSEYAKNVYAP
jgi:hypothetical protein